MRGTYFDIMFVCYSALPQSGESVRYFAGW
jgi:hypothetical protein